MRIFTVDKFFGRFSLETGGYVLGGLGTIISSSFLLVTINCMFSFDDFHDEWQHDAGNTNFMKDTSPHGNIYKKKNILAINCKLLKQL